MADSLQSLSAHRAGAIDTDFLDTLTAPTPQKIPAIGLWGILSSPPKETRSESDMVEQIRGRVQALDLQGQTLIHLNGDEVDGLRNRLDVLSGEGGAVLAVRPGDVWQRGVPSAFRQAARVDLQRHIGFSKPQEEARLDSRLVVDGELRQLLEVAKGRDQGRAEERLQLKSPRHCLLEVEDFNGLLHSLSIMDQGEMETVEVLLKIPTNTQEKRDRLVVACAIAKGYLEKISDFYLSIYPQNIELLRSESQEIIGARLVGEVPRAHMAMIDELATAPQNRLFGLLLFRLFYGEKEFLSKIDVEPLPEATSWEWLQIVAKIRKCLDPDASIKFIDQTIWLLVSEADFGIAHSIGILQGLLSGKYPEECTFRVPMF